MNEHTLYLLEQAANRLQQQANSCRGTACDDHKAYGLQIEADAIREVINILRRAKEMAKEDDSMIIKNHAPHAAQPAAPNGKFRTVLAGPPWKSF